MPSPYTGLSQRVAEAAGVAPYGYASHDFRDPDGYGLEDCECGARFGDVPRGERCPIGKPYYPDLITYEGLGLLLAAMREKRWDVLMTASEAGVWYARFEKWDVDLTLNKYSEHHAELPVAVLLTAAAALGIEGSR